MYQECLMKERYALLEGAERNECVNHLNEIFPLDLSQVPSVFTSSLATTTCLGEDSRKQSKGKFIHLTSGFRIHESCFQSCDPPPADLSSEVLESEISTLGDKIKAKNREIKSLRFLISSNVGDQREKLNEEKRQLEQELNKKKDCRPLVQLAKALSQH